MRRVLAVTVAAMALSGCGVTNEQAMAFGEALKGAGAQAQQDAAPPAATPTGPICILQAQQMSGMYRNCAYNCGGGIVWRSVGAAELCPLNAPP